MTFRIGSIISLGIILAVAAPSPADAANDEHQVVIGLGKAAGGGEVIIVPDPLVIGRDRPAPAAWRLDEGARRAAQRVEIRFESGSPFLADAADGSADTVVSLGPLRQPLDLGSYRYRVHLLGSGGVAVNEGQGTVEIRETTGLPPRAMLIAGGIGVVLLLANYLDRKPLTRSYEH